MTLIRPAVPGDAGLLSGIERSSGEAFRAIAGLEWIADDEVMDPRELGVLMRDATVLVALDEDGPCGFIAGECFGDAFHVTQLSVRHAAQRRGAGTALMRAAEHAARHAGATSLTLTTFRDLPFNQKFYEKLGFTRLDAHEVDARLAGLLESEAARGLPAARRCAMRKVIGPDRNS